MSMDTPPGGSPPAYPPPPPGMPPAYPAASGNLPAYPAAMPAPAWAPPGPAPGLVYAGFWPRTAGYLLDRILLAVVGAVWSVPFVIVPIVQFYQAHPQVTGQSLTPLPADLTNRFLVIGLLGALLDALYFGGLVAWQGRTLGQRVMRIEVVRAEDGGRLPPGRAYLRAAIFWGPGVLGVIPVLGQIAGLVALIGMVAVAWDPRKQGWHDKLARSLVVRRVLPIPGYS